MDELLAGVQTGKIHPRDAKMKMAGEIVSIFYSEAETRAAQEAFIRLFQKREMPQDIAELVTRPKATISEILVEAGLASSKAEASRLIDQKGVRLDGEIMTRADAPPPH